MVPGSLLMRTPMAIEDLCLNFAPLGAHRRRSCSISFRMWCSPIAKLSCSLNVLCVAAQDTGCKFKVIVHGDGKEQHRCSSTSRSWSSLNSEPVFVLQFRRPFGPFFRV